MTRKSLFYMLLFSGIILLFVLFMQPFSVFEFQEYISVLFPKGLIALEQRNLLLIIQVLMLFVIVPVYILTFVFSWKYSASNKKAVYDPDLIDHKVAEFIWWGVPLVMTLAIAILTWIKTYELDPYKPIPSDKKPVEIQVVALQWKWLFLYPEEKIASLNFLQFPKDTPLHFVITADAPMNSFWIPHLGGQIYAMPKMRTELNLIANDTGDFRGSSANLSGTGFASMHFIARSSSEEAFNEWVASAKESSQVLNWDVYEQLVAPSKDNPVETYQFNDISLFDQIIDKYRKPANQ